MIERSATGVSVTHIPYKGAAQNMADLIGGQIDVIGELRSSVTAQTIPGTSSSRIVAGSLAHAVVSRVERIAV